MVLPLLPTYTKEVPVTGSKTWTKGSYNIEVITVPPMVGGFAGGDRKI